MSHATNNEDDEKPIPLGERLRIPSRYLLAVIAIGYGVGFAFFFAITTSRLPLDLDLIYLSYILILAITGTGLGTAVREYRDRHSTKKTKLTCFERKDRVLRHQFLKKFIFIFVPIALVFMFIHYLELAGNSNRLFSDIAFYLQLGLAVSTIMLFGFMNPIYTFRKEFGYYSAKRCFLITKECFPVDQIETNKDENNSVGIIRYMLLGLDFYNVYLKRTTGLQINNINRIYSRITSDNASPARYVKEINDNIDNDRDKLKLVRYLREISSVRENKEDAELEFLVKEKLKDKISTLSTWIIPIIAILISIAQLFFKPP